MTSTIDLSSLISPLLSLAATAGERISYFYTQDIDVLKKQDSSPVTIADEQSHLILKSGLEKILPHIPIISEEDSSSWNFKKPIYWLIDPLDGTAGFIQKSKDFCINIALMENNHPILGLIHLPLTQETFYGYQGKAWLHVGGQTTPIHTRAVPPEGMTLLLGGYGKKYEEEEASFLKSYSISTIQRLQSAIKFCYIAAGKADIYLRICPCSEWDTAAGQALVEAAGGRIETLTNSPFLYGKPQLINSSFVVLGTKNDTPLHA